MEMPSKLSPRLSLLLYNPARAFGRRNAQVRRVDVVLSTEVSLCTEQSALEAGLP